MRWEQLQQTGDVPENRSSHSLTALGDKLYLFGGEHCPRTPINSFIYSYDFNTKAWTKLETTGQPPSPRVAHTAVAVGTDIYFFGGRCGKEMGEGAFNDLYKFDTLTSTWAAVTSFEGSPPPSRSFHAATSIGEKMFIFGGCGETGRLNDLHEFNVKTMTWKQLPSPSEDMEGRGGSCLVADADGSGLFVIAGFAGYELADMHRYDALTGIWCVVPQGTLPRGRSVFGAAVHVCSACNRGNNVITFGGEVDPSTKGHEGAGDFCNDLDCFVAGHGWHKLEVGTTGPCERGWFASTIYHGGLVLHGGLDCNNQRLGDMFLLHVHED